MKVKKLIEKLSQLNPDAEVVKRGSDHSYDKLSHISSGTAEEHDGELYEYYKDYGDGTETLVPIVVVEM
jgi:hypothetical protein